MQTRKSNGTNPTANRRGAKKTSTNTTETTAERMRQKIDTAKQAGVKRNYTEAVKILEDMLITEIPFLKTSPSYFYDICLLLCRAYVALGQYDRAIHYGKVVVKNRTDDAAAFFFLGRAYALANDYRKAIVCFEQALSFKPKSLDVLAMLGFAYLKARRADDAMATFEKALNIAPNSKKLNNGYLNALFVSAVHNFKNGNYELARQMFTFAINNGIDGVAPRLYLAHALKGLQAYPEALTQYEAATQFAPDDTSLQWYKALTLLQMNELQAAAGVLADIGVTVTGDSMSEQALAMGIVQQHIQKGDWARAITAARLYIKSYGESADIHMLIAYAQSKLGRINLALNHYSRALDSEPENPAIYYALFDVLSENYRWDSMQKCLVNAEQLENIDSDIVYFYKVITAAHIDNPPEQVLPHLQALVQNETYVTNAMLYNALGVCYVKLGLPDLALRWYQKTLATYEHNEEALIGIIACNEQSENTAQLLTSYEEYLKAFSNNIPLRREYAQLLFSLQNWPQLVAQLEALSATAHENHDGELAFALRKNGEFRRAALLYRNMLKTKPSDKLLLHNLAYCLDKLDQTQVAIELLQLARQTFGDNHDTMIIEGILHMHCRQYDDAVRLFQYVAENDKNNEVAYHYLNEARAYIK